MPLEALLGLAIPVTYVVLLALEAAVPGRTFPKTPGWLWLGLVFMTIIVTINATAGSWLPIGWLEAHRLFDLSSLGLWGAIPGVIITSFVNYWFHRAEHRFDIVWRVLHQMHHSAERVDISGSAYTHPLEIIIQTTYGLAIATFVLGLSPAAAGIVGYVGALLAMTQHWNVPTPHWVGYLVQRPESHCLHHEYGVHDRNFGDFPVWDMIFGTFENPRTFEGKVGFDTPTLNALARSITFRDVGGARAEGRAAG